MKNKLKVSTRTSSIIRKHEKIIKCLRGYPEGATPKMISRQTRLNVNTVKSILPKLQNVKKAIRGLYKVLEGGDGTFSSDGTLEAWNFHNCVLTADLIPGATAGNGTFHSGLVKCVLSKNSKKNKVTFRISTDYPLNVSSLCLVEGFLRTLVDCGEVMVSTIEFNKDYSNLRLDGIKSISVSSLVGQFKLYQKRRGMRVEHKTKIPFKAENIMDMLSQPPMSVDADVKLHALNKQVNQLLLNQKRHSDALMHLVDKVNA